MDILKYLFIAGIAFLWGLQASHITQMQFPENRLNPFQEYIQEHGHDMEGNIWVSDPTTLIYSDLKAAELMYYPIFNTQRIESLSRRISEANYIFYNSLTLPCRPVDDAGCEQAKSRFYQKIKQNFELVFPKGNSPGQEPSWGIFRALHK